MDTKRILMGFVILVIIGCFTLCSQKIRNEETGITGRWKLEKVTIPFVCEMHDYSRHNVVYEFNTNGILTVSGETDHIELYRGHEIGEHIYSIIADDNLFLYDNGYLLKIDQPTYGFRISSKELEISRVHLDGFLYNFVRINQ